MDQLFHSAPIRLGVGSVIMPGNFGRILAKQGVNHSLWAREMELDRVRVNSYPDRPSWLTSCFACETEAAIRHYVFVRSQAGLEFDHDRHEILLRQPRLPAFLEEVTLRKLRLGQSTVDLMLRRHDNDVSIQVSRNEGQIRIAAVY